MGQLLFWLASYGAVGLCSSAGASVIADRHRTNPGIAAVLTALIWPIVILGVAQLLLWTSVAEMFRSSTAGAPRPMPLTGGVYRL